jgi:hypothetical protein
MSSAATLVLLLFAEDEGHHAAVTRLADRVFCEPPDRGPAWIDPSILEHLREWRGVQDGTAFTPLTHSSPET